MKFCICTLLLAVEYFNTDAYEAFAHDSTGPNRNDFLMGWIYNNKVQICR